MRLIASIVCSSAWLVSAVAGAEELSADEHQAQIAEWLQGQFTNYQQSIQNPEQAVSPLLYQVERLKRQGDEGVLLSSQQMFLFNQEQLLRTQVYQLQTRGSNVVEQRFFHVSGDIENRQDWHQLHGCAVRWRWKGDHYAGARNEDRCYFYNQENGRKIALKSQLKLTPNTYSTIDWAYSEDGTLLLDDAFNSQLVLQRMRFFDADIEYKAPGSDSWQRVHTTHEVHDQGVRVRLQLPESDLELRYQLELVREGEQRVLRIYQGNQAQPVERVQVPVDAQQLEFTMEQLRVRLTPRR
ncbi:CpcT/CpeT family chromophore lyase [Aliidiomarina sp. Khilg15.8]